MRLSKSWQVRIFFIIWFVITGFFAKQPFNFLLLNTFLAYIPIEISIDINYKIINESFLYWPILIIWLLFYPNAPYVLTDLFHLSLLNPYDSLTGLLKLSNPIWINFMLLVISAIVCTFVGAWSLSITVQSLMNKLKLKSQIIRWLLVLIFTFAASVGIFVGRFLRLHTLYLFLSPRLFITPLIKMWTPQMLTFTAIMMVIQIFVYWVIMINQKNITK
ncbi:DUF1361 domain-containing protein [Nicoliella spurrieriana]|uniref:DUF1361 domain-containing protein n=1 Tax=Nicoliella spurrieriana TaxID=2925830 RepID=A0A976X5I9_9LACO|nr:DUF1361 domain-containing protein [Nicoliella spurrieriana]UQS86955.1 DUF1361 domain-containing protein [Nicoliella spurrieriana]